MKVGDTVYKIDKYWNSGSVNERLKELPFRAYTVEKVTAGQVKVKEISKRPGEAQYLRTETVSLDYFRGTGAWYETKAEAIQFQLTKFREARDMAVEDYEAIQQVACDHDVQER